MSSTAGEPIGRAPGVAVNGAVDSSEEAILERAGYKPELRRSLKFFSMFAIAFSTTASASHTGGRRRSGPGRLSGSAT